MKNADAEFMLSQQIEKIVKDCQALKKNRLPPVEFLNIIGSKTYEHFIQVMCFTFLELAERFKLNSRSRILDIGSGCGRLAIPFSMLIKDGKYYGVDVWEDGVEWCKSNITINNNSMNFFCIESKNNYYFGGDSEKEENVYNLDFIDDCSIDFAFAISVFTHLVESDCKQYLNNISRIIHHNGAAYITAFIIDDYFFKYVENTGFHKEVKKISEGYYQGYSGQDIFTGYTMIKWNEMLREAGLKIVAYDVGSWAEKTGAKNYQDTFIIVRA